MYGFFLLLVEEVVVVHDVLQILQVAEQLVGIYQVLVGIVEVADKQLAPEIEIIQRLFAVRFFAEHFVQFAHQPDRVAGFQRRKATEQFADVDICGRPQRAVALSRQVFVEEQAGTLVGEYDCRARQVVPYSWSIVFGLLIEGMFSYFLYYFFFYIPQIPADGIGVISHADK